MAYCTNCGTQVTEGQEFCPNCGKALSGNFTEPGAMSYFPMDPPAVDVPHLANYGWRALGYLVDAILLGLVINLPLRSTNISSYAIAVINIAAIFIYGTLMLTRAGGQTIGMKAARIRCVDAATNGPLTVLQAVKRTGLYCALDLLGTIYHYTRYVNPTPSQTTVNTHHAVVALLFIVPLIVDLLWPLGDKKNQTLHDKFAGTVVVRPPAAPKVTVTSPTS